jgi:hypothetical protein
MKRAVSISLGSSKRNKTVELNLLGETVRIERIGLDGDMEKAAQMYKELDGQVEAFGVGGADMGLMVDTHWYPLYSVKPMVRFIKQTPVVDGSGLKITLERRVAAYLEKHIPEALLPKRAFFTDGADRWGMTMSFYDDGFECAFGDLMFALGLPIAFHKPEELKRFAALLMPVAGRLPFEWVYPTGEKQEKWIPKYEKWYQWATVIAGDCHYIKRHMPRRLDGKVICANTTTTDDVERFRSTGARWLVTTTPLLEGRTFGTNMMEAALIAASGKGRVLTHAELDGLIDQQGWTPSLQELNA